MQRLKNNRIYFALAIAISLIVTVPLPIQLDLHKPLLLAIGGLGLVLMGNGRCDIPWTIFILFLVFSIIWSSNYLESIKYLSIYFGFYLWMTGLKLFSLSEKKRIVDLFSLYGRICIFYISAVIVFFSLDSNNSWNSYFSMNANATSVFCLMIFSFTNHSKKRKDLIHLLVICVSLIFILLRSDSVGCWLAFFVLVAYQLRHFLRPVTVALGLLTSSFIGYVILQHNGFMNSISFQSRLWMLEESSRLFQLKPLLGSGLGSWSMLAYNYSESAIGINSKLTIAPSLNHNIFTTYIVEIGLLGLLLFLLAMFYTIRKSQKKYALFLFVLIYATCGLFYNNLLSGPLYFSESQFILFTSLALYTD